MKKPEEYSALELEYWLNEQHPELKQKLNREASEKMKEPGNTETHYTILRELIRRELADGLFEGNLYLSRKNLMEAINFHEAQDHGGEPCINERVNAIAFLSHSLGLKQENIAQLGELLAAADERHAAAHGHS